MARPSSASNASRLANDGGAKAYIHSLGEALPYEFKPHGVYVTVVPPPLLTNTAVLAKLGFGPRTMPMKPMSVEQCVSEGLNALRENRSRIVPVRLNRFMDALVPAFENGRSQRRCWVKRSRASPQSARVWA
jgi:short-subunit dehydrogenase